MPHPIKITKKHHKRFNNPFPSRPKSLALAPGNLFSSNQTLPNPHQNFPIGHDFQLHHTHQNGGVISISHNSPPHRSIWSTVPGQAFVSAACAGTEAEESRGSFVIKDRDVLCICNHQFIEDIQVLDKPQIDFSSGSLAFDPKTTILDQFKGTHFPALVITGWIFSRKKLLKSIIGKSPESETKKLKFRKAKKLFISARYSVLFYQQNRHQVGFRVEFGKPNLELPNSRDLARASKSFRRLRWRLGQLQKRRIAWFQGRHRFKKLSSEEDEDEDEDKEEKIGEVKGFNRIFMTYMSEEDEKFYGFGEQFSHMEFKGKRVPIFVQEQGIGRGDQPITLAANLVSYRSGGDSSTTYAPSPFYMTSKMRSLYLEGYSYSVFDLTELNRVQIQIYDGCAQGRILYGNTPVELIERFTETIGRPPVLPKWIISGAVVGMQGGTEAVFHVWDHLRKYKVPIAAFWLQDWVGKRNTIIGSQLWWNWEVDTEQYPGWTQLVEDLRSHNIKIMTYCNPCLAPTDDKPNRKRNLFEEANNLDILVKDKAGDTYMVPNTAFDVGMLDFTHPSACIWFKKILHEMVNSGVRGWMADFGEGLPLDACIFSGEDSISAHNRYPEIWAKINREVVDEWKSMHESQVREEDDDDDDDKNLVFFMRAGFRESPKWATLFWEGDQMVSWQRNDGIKSAVVGLLSSGLCGYAFNHSDIGGYCAVNLPIIGYQRSEELLLRWMELNAFSTVFRTHEGNNPSANTQFYSNDRALLHFARFAKIYKAWEFYRVQLVKEGAQNGLPVCRHLFIHYPEDEHVHKLTYQQFLVGTEMLVVPVLDKGKNEAKAYFPVARGSSWIHIWTGKCYGKSFDRSSKKKLGFEARVEAPIGYPAVFVKFDSPIGQTFLRNLRDLGVL